MTEISLDSLTEVIAASIKSLTDKDNVNSTSYVEDILEARYMAVFRNIADDYDLPWLKTYVDNDLDIRRSIDWHHSDALTLIAQSLAGRKEEENIGLTQRIRELFGG